MVLPIVKLVSLFIRLSSRPVVHRLTVSAAHHPKFGSVIVLIAQSKNYVIAIYLRLFILKFINRTSNFTF